MGSYATLREHLAKWAGDDTQRRAIADTITNLAKACVDVAHMVALGPLAGDMASKRGDGDHSDGGPITVRDGRFGAYVNWGKINATIPKSIPLDSITLLDAIELIAEREGKPSKPARKPAAAKTAATAKPKAAAKQVPTKKTAEAEPNAVAAKAKSRK